MAKKLSSALGVDIGCRSIKVAEVRTQGKDPVVTALGIIETPVGAVDHTGIQNPDAVGAAIRQCAQSAGAAISDVVASINGQASVLVKVLEVPRMTKEELEQHMAWEIQNQSPFAESTILSDYRQLPDEDPNSANMDVVMAAAPQSAIDILIATFKKAGKKLGAVDVPPLSSARSLVSSYADAIGGQTVCLVDVGHKVTSINIYRDGKLLWPRQVPIGGENFTQAISDAFGLSVEDAEAKKVADAVIPAGAGTAAAAPVNPFGDPSQAYAPYATSSGEPTIQSAPNPYNPFADPADASAGAAASPPPVSSDPYAPPVDGPPVVDAPPVDAPDADAAAADAPPVSDPAPAASAPVPQDNPEQVTLYNSFAATLGEFLEEVRRSIDFYRSRGGTVDRVFITGGGSKIKGLPEYLNEALGLPCDLYDPTRRLNVNLRKVAPQFVDDHKQEFTVAIGNGLFGIYD